MNELCQMDREMAETVPNKATIDSGGLAAPPREARSPAGGYWTGDLVALNRNDDLSYHGRMVHRIDSMPLNTSGKVDRKRLLALRESQG